MAAVHLFNPENDLALAADLENYTPPVAARCLAESGALLPLYWAQEGDIVLVPHILSDRARKFAQALRPDVEISTSCPSDCVPDPWGWSRYARRLFLKAGVSPANLPTDRQLEKWRWLSHRRSTITIHREFGIEEPVEVYNVDAGIRRLRQLQFKAILKLPWSSSGRGVFSTGDDEEQTATLLQSMLRRQGSVIIERRHAVDKDFAALYFAHDGKVEFRGLSYFLTEGCGRYSGNIVAGDKEIIGHIGADIIPTAESLLLPLSVLLDGSDYEGWFGVDMLTFTDERGERRIEPCVEINLRRTMGVVAKELYTRGMTGLFRIGNINREVAVSLLPPGRFSFDLVR